MVCSGTCFEPERPTKTMSKKESSILLDRLASKDPKPKKKRVRISRSKKKVAHTDITILLDRSGSMSSIQDGVVEGVNAFIRKMREAPGDNKWSLLQFDSPSYAGLEGFPLVSFENQGEKDVPFVQLSHSRPSDIPADAKTIKFEPRGSTALLDAVGHTINRIDQRTSGQDVKPVLMIVTDGLENASCTYSNGHISAMAAERKAKGWEFLYIGANQDSWGVASRLNLDSVTKTAYQYRGSSVLSGAVGSGAGFTYNFQATSEGIKQALNSGVIGCFYIASGNLAEAKSKKPTVQVNVNI